MIAIAKRREVIEQLKEDKEQNRKKYGEKFFYIREFIYFIPAKLSMLYTRCELLRTQNLIIVGSAGNGKTNLLCSLTENIIKNSVYFPRIEQRYRNFSKENLLTLTYTDAIVDFNASLIDSKLRGDYILFENQKTQGYNYLSIAMDAKQNRYVESFFYNPTDIYIRNQQIVKVAKVEIYDKNGELYLEDRVG